MMNNRDAVKIAEKANRKAEMKKQKEVRPIIRTIKADIKATAKKGVRDLRVRVKSEELYNRAKSYFESNGFRCWNYTMGDIEYLGIEW